VIGVLVVAITLALGLPAAYALARLDRPGRSRWRSEFYGLPRATELLFLALSRMVVTPTGQLPVSTGVPTQLVRGDVFFWQSLQAAAVLVAVPIAFVFTWFLDKFVSGFTMGAVKE
jgi:ABC-type maltose transport system permease subunit